MNFFENTEILLEYLVHCCTTILELFGIIILICSALKCFFQWIKKNSYLRLNLAQSIALSLEFKMGSEVLRTVIVRDWSELGILAAIIILRGILTFLIHWEIKYEEEALRNKKNM